MSRSLSCIRYGVLTALVLAVLLATAVVSVAGETGGSAPDAVAARVSSALQELEGRIDRLETDIGRAEHVAATPPPLFSGQAEQLRWRINEALRPLRGLHWSVTDPLLKQAMRLRGRLAGLKDRLDNWQPELPPDPNRPLKVSAPTGTGAITGTLTDEATGDPIPYTRVEVYCPNPSFDAETMTDANGVYTMGGLATGTCYARTWNQLAYIDEVYDDISCAGSCWVGSGTPITVVDGQTISGIDFALARYGEVRGVVTDAQDGSPIGDVSVNIYDTVGDWVGYDRVDSSGTYTAQLAPGTYFILTSGSGYTYIDELYDDIPCQFGCDPTTGTPVAVSAGQITNGINFALDHGGTISGTITDAVSGAPLISSITVFDVSGIALPTSWNTFTDGTYTVLGLPAGTYFVKAEDNTHVAELYDDIPCLDGCDPTSGTPIPVTTGADTPNIDFALQPLPVVSGSVTDSRTADPLNDIWVSLYDDTGSYIGGTVTDEAGRYSYGRAHPGTVFAEASNNVYIGELYQEMPCPYACDPTTGTPITLVLGSDATGIDFTLDRESWITGTVTSAGGSPLWSIKVDVYDSGGAFVDSDWTDEFGRFAIHRLPAATYYVLANENWDSEWIAQLYNGIDCLQACDPTTGDPVVTAVGGVTDISFSLNPYGRILGTVTDAATGLPVASARVKLYDSQGNQIYTSWTRSDGTYHFVGLDTGTYRAVAEDDAYFDELYDNIPCEGGCNVNLGTPIGVIVGTDTTGIDFALNIRGSISGQVTDALTGGPLGSAYVSVYDSQGTRIKSSWTSSGFFSVVGLPAGTYFVATQSTGFYQDELYDDIPCEGGCDVTTGTPVVVVDGADTSGIDFALEPDPIFDDVPIGFWARYWIQTLYANGVTAGCSTNPPLFCPGTVVSRDQMSVLILKSIEGGGYTPPPAVGVFNDVPVESNFAPWIEEIAARGIIVGCGPNLFCPSAPTTRREMAMYLIKGLEGPLYVPPPATGVFNDVPLSDPYAPWIEDIAARGITVGCSANPPLFCPGSPVTRDQMAVFLVKTFGLQ